MRELHERIAMDAVITNIACCGGRDQAQDARASAGRLRGTTGCFLMSAGAAHAWAGMPTSCLPDDPDLVMPLLAAPRDWLLAGHLVHFIGDTVDALDLQQAAEIPLLGATRVGLSKDNLRIGYG